MMLPPQEHNAINDAVNPNSVATPQQTTAVETNEPAPLTMWWAPKSTNASKNPAGTASDIDSSLDKKEEAKKFGTFAEDTTIAKKRYDFLQINTAVLIAFLFVLVGIIFLAIAKINVRSYDWSNNYPWVTDGYKNIVTSIDQLIDYPWIETQKSLSNDISKANIDAITASSIPYIFKKEIMNWIVNTLLNWLLTKETKIADTNKEISEYGFIHPDVMNLIDGQKDQVPIMVSLHTIETIKFGTAFKIFSLLDTFLQQAVQTLRSDKETIVTTLQDYAEHGEADIANYLSMCYLNPYEKLPDCDQIGDFDNYLKYEKKEDSSHGLLFKKLIALTDNKLENSTIPSLQIVFNNFNPSNQNVWFTVTINTLLEDEAAFIARWILNPHIYIISTLVSLLKQSLFVIGDSINVDQVTIKEQTINIGNIQIPVNSATMSFDLPLQNDAEREIFDYYQK